MVPVSRRQTLALLASCGASLATPSVVTAQAAYPSRPVKFVVGSPPGGATDILSRLYCQKMTDVAGQTFVVENKAGAGGIVGALEVALAAPDGYTVGLATIGVNALASGIYKSLPFNPATDFTLFSGLWKTPNILCVRKDFPAKNSKDFLALVRANPGKFTYSTAGAGTTGHLCMEMLNTMAGCNILHVPYKGAAAAMADVLAGRVDMKIESIAGAIPFVRDHRVIAIAVTSKDRNQFFPNVPTWQEDLPGLEMTAWCGVMGPAKMPADILARFIELNKKALGDPGLRAKFADLGAETWWTTTDEITRYRAEQEDTFRPIIKAAGIEPQ